MKRRRGRGAARQAAASYQPRLAFTTRTTSSITGTSISTPTTVGSAAPDSNPNRLIAAATASSKKLLAPINAEGHATSCASPTRRFNQYASAELKKTWIRIGTASIAMTSGWSRMARPWKANSSTSVVSSAPMDQGPIFASAASNAAWPRASSILRHHCARMTGITMYSTTDVMSVAQGTTIADRPRSSATIGANANTISGNVVLRRWALLQLKRQRH
jgi:hypothetical protein